MAHFTCVGATVEELHDALRQMRDAGIENVLALRGDPPRGAERVRARPRAAWATGPSSPSSSRATTTSASSAPATPRCTSRRRDAETDLTNLERKVAAGVRVLVTQLFFDNEAYFRFVEAARERGIDVPIVPGIMPITNFEQIKRFTSMCGATIPPTLMAAARGARRRPRGRARAGLLLRDAPVRRPAGARRARDPLLHAQPLTGDARDPRDAQAAPAVGARAGPAGALRTSRSPAPSRPRRARRRPRA